MAYLLYRGETDADGKTEYRQIGEASSSNEADAICKSKAEEYVRGRASCVIYPLGPRGNRKFGQPQLPLPAGKSYLIFESPKSSRGVSFGWKKTG
jgi:hypothetical protein